MRLPRWHDSNRLRGYGHVEFSCKSAAEEALDMDGFYIDQKRFIKVTKPMVPRAMLNAKISTTSSDGRSNEGSKPIEAPPGTVLSHHSFALSLASIHGKNTTQSLSVHHRPYSFTLTPMRKGCFKCTTLYLKEHLTSALRQLGATLYITNCIVESVV